MEKRHEYMKKENNKNPLTKKKKNYTTKAKKHRKLKC